MPKWGSKDGNFNLAELYHIVVALLSAPKEEWVVETLNWWQKYVSASMNRLSTMPQPTTHNRKLFGDKQAVKGVAERSKTVRATTSTMYYALLVEQLEGGDANDEVSNM